MGHSRQLPLFDASQAPGAWNERMVPGEYAVQYSQFEGDAPVTPYCTVFDSLQGATTYAQEQVKSRTDLRCTIYDHHGLIGAPIRDIRGVDYKDGEVSERLRRWIGSVLLFGGLGLTLYDWVFHFQLQWPSTIGMRMVVPGFTVLFVEAMFLLHRRLQHGKSAEKGFA